MNISISLYIYIKVDTYIRGRWADKILDQASKEKEIKNNIIV